MTKDTALDGLLALIDERIEEAVERKLAALLHAAPANDDKPSGYLDTKQVAALLKLAVVTVEQMRARGEGPPFFRSSKRRIVYDPAAVENWLRNRPR